MERGCPIEGHSLYFVPSLYIKKIDKWILAGICDYEKAASKSFTNIAWLSQYMWLLSFVLLFSF